MVALQLHASVFHYHHASVPVRLKLGVTASSASSRAAMIRAVQRGPPAQTSCYSAFYGCWVVYYSSGGHPGETCVRSRYAGGKRHGCVDLPTSSA